MSVLSASPFHYQLAKQTCPPTDLWPNFKPSTPYPKDTSKPEEPQQDAPQSALDRAFIAAREALQGDSVTQRQLGWTSIQPLLHDQTDHETVLPGPATTDVSLKRKAEAAGIHDEGEDTKKCEIEFIDFHTQMQRKKPGRPSKGFQRPKKAMKGFRTNRPVAAELTRGDIWCHILENSPLSQLFRMRDVFRHYLLTWPTIWKTARRNTYGQDHPDPPPGISERQYADLLVGFGCQGKGCNDTRTRKVYWAFQRRWCVACMKKNVAMNAGCHLFFRNYPDIPQCVPRAAFDQYGHYTCALGVGDNDKYTCTLSHGQNVRPPWLKQGYQDKVGYLRADLARMSQEFEESEKQVSSLDEAGISDARKAWVDNKKRANDQLVERLQSIEDWMETYKMNIRKEAETKRRDTTDAFIDTHMFTTAALMNTPSEESSERAETVPQAREGSFGHPSGKDTELIQDEPLASRAKEYTACADARVNTPPPETVAVVALAHRIVEDMKDSRTLRSVADGDFVRVALMRTYKKFQEDWAACRPDRPSPLLMDDARRVYQEVIEPRLDVRVKRSSFRRTEATGSVTCPGCKKGRGPVKLYSFPDLMTHIFEQHAADGTGDFKDFRVDPVELPFHVRFPWCSIEWPRNLPILAVGQDTKGRWDLHAEGEEHPQLSYCDPGAFDGRVAAASMGPPAFQFVPNVLFAASQLEQSSLGDESQTQIVLEFAVQKYESARHSRPGFDLLEELQLALMRNGVKGLFEGFRCQKCCEAVVHEGRVGYLARSVKPLGELSEHFRKAHVKGGDWTRNMLDLPSAQDLLAELQLPVNRSSLTVFESLFPTQGDSTLDPQLRRMATAIG
ncbi:MAG: hypothetical protein L6R38_000304 [Xanthoria sp. 2 TBL-2021]|nr:MAG: hypothetical protein L6R38_000304 [Xanthoria sp. 2 TBL-2021]